MADCQLYLQMCVYFNAFFSPGWFIVQIVCLIYKFESLIQLYKILLVIALLVNFPLELLRLYLGYTGNLRQKVPELAGFWLLTMFLRFPIHCWLMSSQGPNHLPVETVTNFILMLFIVAEILTSYFVLKNISQEQANKFKQKTLVDLTTDSSD